MRYLHPHLFEFDRVIVLGDKQRAPRIAEVLQLLEHPEQNAVVNLLAVPLEDRPSFFVELLPRVQGLRVRTGQEFLLSWPGGLPEPAGPKSGLVPAIGRWHR